MVEEFVRVMMDGQSGVKVVCLRLLRGFGVLWGARSRRLRDLLSWM